MRRTLLLCVCAAWMNAHAQESPKPMIRLATPVPVKPRAIQWPGAGVATSGLGFFCRQELKMDKQTVVPLRFRLGSMQQNDWLERKPNAVRPGQ